MAKVTVGNSSHQSVKDHRFQAMNLVLASLFGIAALSQAKLQLLETGSTIALAEGSKRYMGHRDDRPQRGTILSIDGKPLAEDGQSTEVSINYANAPMSDAFALDVAQASGIPAEEIRSGAEEYLRGGSKGKTWYANLEPESVEELAKVRGRWGADGLSVAESGHRHYALGESLSCVIGSVHEASVDEETVIPGAELLTGAPMKAVVPNRVVTRTGLESSLNADLSGVSGYVEGQVDSRGSFLPTRMKPTTRVRKDGKNVVLTIDSELQTLAYDSLKEAVTTNAAKQGTVVVMNPHTGDILAMANYPSYDPTEGAENEANATDFNASYMALLPPGSTFKILTLAKALEVCPDRVARDVNCTGELKVGARSRVRCDNHHGNRAHGRINATTAIAKSCNVAAATWALGIGHDQYLSYLTDLGLLAQPKLGLPGEISGRYSNDPAKALQLATWGFGQSINVTPIGLASAISMLGNDGLRMKPRLIDSIGGVKQRSVADKQIVKPSTASEVMKCMQAVFDDDHGTGHGLRIPGYSLAGKTGTSQKLGRDQRGYVSNFVGFVPAPSCKAMVLVMIDQPSKGAYYGATVAGPVFKTVARGIIHRFGIRPQMPVKLPTASMATPPEVTVTVKEQAAEVGH